MKILYISYWGIHEGLSTATVLPHVDILASFPQVEKIILCSIERSGNVAPVVLGEKMIHVPLISDDRGSVLLTKARDFFVFPKVLVKRCATHGIDFILCRSSLAGALGHLVYRKTSIPYAVESFEPHADYMIETGIWNRYDPRSLIQLYFEKKIRQSAKTLLPVSFHYRDVLIAHGVREEKIIVQPCCVDLDRFSYAAASRKKIRQQHGIPDDATVAIYVGKFGHMYYDVEAFKLYADAFRFFGKTFYVIILSPDAPEIVHGYIQQVQLPDDRIVFRRHSPMK